MEVIRSIPSMYSYFLTSKESGINLPFSISTTRIVLSVSFNTMFEVFFLAEVATCYLMGIVGVSRYVPTKKSVHSTPSKLFGGGDLDLPVKFPFSLKDFIAARILDSEGKWKFDLRRDLGIHLDDADVPGEVSNPQSSHWRCTSSFGFGPNTAILIRFLCERLSDGDLLRRISRVLNRK